MSITKLSNGLGNVRIATLLVVFLRSRWIEQVHAIDDFNFNLLYITSDVLDSWSHSRTRSAPLANGLGQIALRVLGKGPGLVEGGDEES